MRINLKMKLFGGFGLVLVLIILVSLLTFNQLNQSHLINNQAAEKMNQVSFLLEKEIDHWSWVSQLVDWILIDKEFQGQLDPHKCGFGTWYYELKESADIGVMSQTFQTGFADIEEPHNQLHATAEKIIKVFETEQDHHIAENKATEIYQKETVVYLNQIRDNLSVLRKQLNAENQALTNEIADNEKMMKTMLAVATIVAVIVGMLIAFLVNRGITVPVKAMVDMLKDMAQSGGDLTKRVNVSVKDEIGELAGWFNAFLDNLHDIMAQVKHSSETVSAAANETSMGNQDLSQRTEEQASSLEEVSSTIEEISASLQKSSDNSGEADKISRTTLDSVRSSEKVVGEMRDAMGDITKGSHEIAEIIAKVNDIAFQTNLLALNAAVEAARAGEQGRGFAVVAAEVRNLAGRTAESAKEIEGLIKDSIVRVDKGNELMDGVSDVLTEIIKNTEQTSEVIIEIASSTKEQAAAAEDIRTAIEQLNQVTQQNASLVEEIAGSSEAVSNEAEELATLVGKFKLNDNTVSSNQKVNLASLNALNGKGNKTKPQVRQISAEKMVAAASEPLFNEDDFEKF